MVAVMETDDAEAFLLGIANSKIPNEITNSNLDEDEQSLLRLGLEKGGFQESIVRTFRIYNLVARSISGDEEDILEYDLISTIAGKHRAKYRRMGYRVDLIETNSGDGIVVRIPDPIEEYGKGVPNPVTYDSRRTESRNRGKADRIRSAMMNAENNRLRKIGERAQNDKCFVYHKATNALQFSGSPTETAEYLDNRSAAGNLNMEETVIYIPDHVLRKGR